MKQMKKMRYKKSGFTLLEVLLSVALISVIIGIGIPVYQSYQNRNNLDIAVNSYVNTLRRAQILSQAVDGDARWGVRIQTGSITLFQGNSYAARDTDFDEIFGIQSSITLSGLQEVVFSRFTGLPLTDGTLTLTSSNNESRNISLNEKGMVNY